MDAGLLAWGRAVKQRQRSKYPVLWLFTDAGRLPDPLPAIARLPAGRCGVVFRHDGMPRRAELAVQVAGLCKKRRLKLVVAGDSRLAALLGAGCHLRGGVRQGHLRPLGLVTSSAHDIPGLRRARRARAKIIFLSPIFATASHPEQPAMGPVRWANMARRGQGVKIYSLGGVSRENIKLLPRICSGVGAISALIPQFNRNVT